jgi:hypothetical protein
MKKEPTGDVKALIDAANKINEGKKLTREEIKSTIDAVARTITEEDSKRLKVIEKVTEMYSKWDKIDKNSEFTALIKLVAEASSPKIKEKLLKLAGLIDTSTKDGKENKEGKGSGEERRAVLKVARVIAEDSEADSETKQKQKILLDTVSSIVSSLTDSTQTSPIQILKEIITALNKLNKSKKSPMLFPEELFPILDKLNDISSQLHHPPPTPQSLLALTNSLTLILLPSQRADMMKIFGVSERIITSVQGGERDNIVDIAVEICEGIEPGWRDTGNRVKEIARVVAEWSGEGKEGGMEGLIRSVGKIVEKEGERREKVVEAVIAIVKLMEVQELLVKKQTSVEVVAEAANNAIIKFNELAGKQENPEYLKTRFSLIAQAYSLFSSLTSHTPSLPAQQAALTSTHSLLAYLTSPETSPSVATLLSILESSLTQSPSIQEGIDKIRSVHEIISMGGKDQGENKEN